MSDLAEGDYSRQPGGEEFHSSPAPASAANHHIVAPREATVREVPEAEEQAGDELILLRVRESFFSWSYWLRVVATLGLYGMAWHEKHLTITSHRVMWRHGVLRPSQEIVPLDDIRDVTVSRGGWGRVGHYGTVRIWVDGDDEARIAARNVQAAERVHRTIALAREERFNAVPAYAEIPPPWLQLATLVGAVLLLILVAVVISGL